MAICTAMRSTSSSRTIGATWVRALGMGQHPRPPVMGDGCNRAVAFLGQSARRCSRRWLSSLQSLLSLRDVGGLQRVALAAPSPRQQMNQAQVLLVEQGGHADLDMAADNFNFARAFTAHLVHRPTACLRAARELGDIHPLAAWPGSGGVVPSARLQRNREEAWAHARPTCHRRPFPQCRDAGAAYGPRPSSMRTLKRSRQPGSLRWRS